MLNQRTYAMNELQIIHMPKKSYCEVNAGVDGVEYSMVGYEADLGNRLTKHQMALLAEYNPFEMVYHLTPSQPVALYDLLSDMLELSQLQEQTALLELKAAFYQWLSGVIQQYHAKPQAAKPTSPAELVTMTLEYMLKHYADPHTLDTLAAAMNRSPGHLSNCFKQVLNRGPIDCLIRLRMRKACELLTETKLPLYMIASAIGYRDAYYFSNAFKKQMGMSPQAFRKHDNKEDITSQAGRNSIARPNEPCYISIHDNDNYYQHMNGGSDNMFNFAKMVPASLLLAFGLLLGACGSANTGNSTNSNVSNHTAPQTTSEATATADSAANGGTRLVSTSMGEVAVPDNPQRVVTDFYLGYLLALDVKPVGTNRMFMENPYLQDQVEGIMDVSENLEAIVAANPDLIVTGDAQKYEAYSKIATAVYLDHSTNIREQVKQLGVILNKEAEAAAWLEEFEEKLAGAKKRVQALLKEGETAVVFAGGIQKELTLYGNAYTGGTIHGELGIPMNENVIRDIDPKTGWATISSEVVDHYAGDHIFMSVDTKKESFDYASDPLWGTLPAVKNNKLYEIDGYRFYFSDPISVMNQIQDIANMMEEGAKANVAK
ncbi:AraC family transcriptional regulator [Paenibacillus sp. NPDC057967]|uniref:AraC family transcriptional regulator n=1 Tax=Paenibacillus sp. NPDC057967 TaxID=3346293 RepID=UPI0036DB9D8A